MSELEQEHIAIACHRASHIPKDGCIEKCGSCLFCCCFVCSKCGLLEGALTSHCSNSPVSPDKLERIYKGQLNYRGGIWLEECSEHSPAFLHKHEKEWKEQHS